jgi:Raf kinase inhibitor-like YbhB/YbcL family protein
MACSHGRGPAGLAAAEVRDNQRVADFAMSSSAFAAGRPIPARYTCEGEDVSPPIAWSHVPEQAHSLALIVDDPDAPGGTFTHWLAWAMDPAANGLAEGERAPAEGVNDFGSVGYRGPCPPPSHGTHRYVFRLFALDTDLDLAAATSRQELEQAIGTHALAVAELTGTYERL